MSDMAKPFRVLTLDGGGMRGLYTASLLRALARLVDQEFVQQEPDLGKGFDLICGTSTGAILASALATGAPLGKVCDLYCQHGASIFPSPMPKRTQKLKMTRWIKKHLSRPAARAEKLKSCLDNIFADLTLGDLYSKRQIALCIPTVDALNHRSWIFKTPHVPAKHRDNNYRIADVCMASTAAPIFFPLSNQQNPDNPRNAHYFVDGGLWANNPVLVGIVEALGLAQAKQAIEVISVGTCDHPSGDPYAVEDPNWGLWNWKAGVNIVELSMAAQSFGSTSIAKLLAKSLTDCGRPLCVVRLEEGNKSPDQYSAIGLDRADKTAINTLVSLAEQDAGLIYGKMLSAPSDNDVLRSVFGSLRPLE